MSKKLAGGAQRIVLDVKVGRGAFMHDLESARKLAEEMVRIGMECGVATSAMLTSMEEPLGLEVGNGLEVREALETLRGECRAGSLPFRELCIALAAHSLVVTGRAADDQEGMARAEHLLEAGEALRKFEAIVAAQGGPRDSQAILDSLHHAPIQHDIRADVDGVVASIDALAVGWTAVALGAGRRRKGDTVDHSAGITFAKKTGDAVVAGDLLATLHLQRARGRQAPELADQLRNAIQFAPAGVEVKKPVSLVIGHVP